MCHVLIIEDEWLIDQSLTYLAEQAGATSIATAFTEDEAIQAARERTPDVISSDVKRCAKILGLGKLTYMENFPATDA
jgi:YesN/AraC family two-component response regulator